MKKQISIFLCLLVLVAVLLTGCSKEVAVDTSGLQNITFTGEAVATTKEAYTATLTPAEHYALPEMVTVTVDGAALTEGYSFDPATGTLTIDGASITSDIAISATATESIVGVWEGTVDLTEYLTTMITEGDESMNGYFNFSGLTMDLTMTFTEEGTCTLEFPRESAEALIASLLEQMKPAMEKILEEAIAAEGLDMTLDEFLSLTGISLDDLLAEAMDTAMAEDMLGELEQSGNYLVQDGKLCISDDLDSEIDEDDYQLYTIKNGVLTIEVAEGNTDEENILFPLTLTRAD